MIRATGGAVVAGEAVVALGCFGAAALAADGSVVAAMGGPDAVLFLARAPGRARIEVMRGDPWQGKRQPIPVTVVVARRS